LIVFWVAPIGEEIKLKMELDLILSKQVNIVLHNGSGQRPESGYLKFKYKKALTNNISEL